MNMITKFVTLSIVLIIAGSMRALEIRKPKDLNCAIEIYERNGSGHNELVGAAIGFRDTVPGLPLYRKTNITLKSPLTNATIITIDKDTDEMIQKFSFKEPLRDNCIIELGDCKDDANKKSLCSLRHEIVAPTKHSADHNAQIKQLDKLIEELESMGRPLTPISKATSSDSFSTSPSPDASPYTTPTSTSASPSTTPDIK
jgi:hypothetical protein